MTTEQEQIKALHERWYSLGIQMCPILGGDDRSIGVIREVLKQIKELPFYPDEQENTTLKG